MRSGGATGGLAALVSEGRTAGQGGAPASAGGRREVVLRVVSAAILAPLGLYVVYAGGWVLAVATGVCSAIAGMEWARMAAGGAGRLKLALYVIGAAGAAAAVTFGGKDLEYAAMVSLATAAMAALAARLAGGSMASLAFGGIYTTLPFGAFVWIRASAPHGWLFLYAVLAVVWATDIAAYFAGRGFGGPLLSPKDSPNKTWTGAIGAVVCACLAGVAVARAAGGPLPHWLAFSLILSVVAQVGDLLESRFKRLYGVKDTSGLVPGHGGVLDRLDALMAAVTLSALLMRFLPFAVPAFGPDAPG